MGSVTSAVAVDTSWMVPHSPKLSRIISCHLNVKLCELQLEGIKYSFKYVCKGHDIFTVNLIN